MEEDTTRSEGLGRAIRVIRTGHDMSRKELARRAGMSYSYLAEIETSAKQPSSKALAIISKALGIAPHELMEAAERWEHAPPPHSYTQLRGLQGAAPATSLTAASTRRELLRQVEATRFRSRGYSNDEREVSSAIPAEYQSTVDDTPSLEQAADELLDLLARLEPEDRERLLDLARRLGAGE